MDQTAVWNYAPMDARAMENVKETDVFVRRGMYFGLLNDETYLKTI